MKDKECMMDTSTGSPSTKEQSSRTFFYDWTHLSDQHQHTSLELSLPVSSQPGRRSSRSASRGDMQVTKEKLSGEQVMLLMNTDKDANKKKLLVPKECTIADLYKRARKHLGNVGQDVGMVLYFGGEALDESSQKTIQSYGIVHGNSLEMVIMAIGGSNCLKPLPGYMEVTDEPCCIYYSAEPVVKQARMACGCVVGVEAMKQHCTTLVKDSRFLFTCPSCLSSLNYLLVRHILSAAMSDDALELFNRKVNSNLMNSCIKIQRCPGCNVFLQRDSSKTFSNPNWVQCPACSARNGKRFEFCWVCLKPWKGGSDSCGNDQCTGKDPRIQILETCKTKVIGLTSDVPNTRCCARCGTMIEHKDKCKHMNCPKCHYEFCFICLKPKTSENKTNGWQCGAYDSSCNVAPRQTNLFDIDTENVSERNRSAVQTHRPTRPNYALFGIFDEEMPRQRSILSRSRPPRRLVRNRNDNVP